MPEGRPILGYVGAVNAKIDFDLLRAFAQKAPDWNVVLLGHDNIRDALTRERFDRLLACDNVHYLGLKQRAELGGYLQGFTVCAMPYAQTPWGRYQLPLKMLEYFATGKPIVSTSMPSLEEYRDTIDVCDTHESFIETALRRAAEGDPRGPGRVKFASRNTWGHRADTALSALGDALSRKGQGA
jgi:glycosyltransferase involved in cell wall biosynthesis